jgi:hypothetical protein
MTDLIDQAADVTPDEGATASPDPVAALRAEMETRIGGLQTALNRAAERAQQAESERDELKNAGLSDDEKAQLVVQKAEKRIRDLEARLELASLAKEYGEDMPFYQRLLDAKTAKDQLEVIRELRAAASAAGGSPSVVVPPVDANRPAPSGDSGITLPDGTQMTDAIADRILRSVGRNR